MSSHREAGKRVERHFVSSPRLPAPCSISISGRRKPKLQHQRLLPQMLGQRACVFRMTGADGHAVFEYLTFAHDAIAQVRNTESVGGDDLAQLVLVHGV